MDKQIPVNELAIALFTINRHAKTAPEPDHLYNIKKEAIHKLLKEKRAKKIGLHFTRGAKLSNQHSTVLIQVDKYYFHVPPSKEDFKKLKHLGSLDQNYRNPPTKMPLSRAKKLIYKYINWKPKKQQPSNNVYTSNYYTPSSLGKLDWPPRNAYNRAPNRRTKPKTAKRFNSL